jgi:hypothetical protein
MPNYSTTVIHSLGRREAVERLKSLSEEARSFSGLEGGWAGNVFTFSVSAQGVWLRGALRVEADSLELQARLPLVAMPFAGWIARPLKKAIERRPRVKAVSAAPGGSTVHSHGGASGGANAPAVLFLRIPKAGGTTLGEAVYSQRRAGSDRTTEGELYSEGVLFPPYGFFKEADMAVPEYVRHLLTRPDLRAVIGDFWFGLHEHVARPSTYITVLRDPVERVVSLYYYAKLHEAMSLEEFLASPPFKEVDNDQTRRLAGVDPPLGGCTADTLDAARGNLKRHFAVVGTTERFDETLILLKRRLGWTRDVASYPRNVNAKKPPASTLPPETVAAIRRRNELDFELWRFASELLDEAIEAEGPDFAAELERHRAALPA